jgi:hypothetical protein
MTDEETKFVESLMQQIERASQERREVLNDKLVKLDQRLVQEDLHISDLIETIIHRARKRELDQIEQLDELRSLVSHRAQISPPPLRHDEETTVIANRFAPESASQTPPPLNGRQAMQRVMNGSHGVN